LRKVAEILAPWFFLGSWREIMLSSEQDVQECDARKAQ